MTKRRIPNLDFAKRYMIHICKDGTISYRDTLIDEPVFNGVALPVFSVDTEYQAKQIQLRFGRKQYINHPQMADKPYSRISILECEKFKTL